MIRRKVDVMTNMTTIHIDNTHPSIEYNDNGYH